MDSNVEAVSKRRTYAFLRHKLGMKFKIFEGKVYFIDLDATEMMAHYQQQQHAHHGGSTPIDVKGLLYPTRKRTKSLEISAKLEDFLQHRESLQLNQSEVFDDNESEASSKGEVSEMVDVSELQQEVEEKKETEASSEVVEATDEIDPVVLPPALDVPSNDEAPGVVEEEAAAATAAEPPAVTGEEEEGETEAQDLTTEADDDIPTPALPPPIPPPVPTFAEPQLCDVVVQSEAYFGEGQQQTFAYNFADEYSSSITEKLFDLKYRLSDLYQFHIQHPQHGDYLLTFWNEDDQNWMDLTESTWLQFVLAANKIINVHNMPYPDHQETAQEVTTQHFDEMPDLPPPPPPPVPTSLPSEGTSRRRLSASSPAFAVHHNLHAYHNEYWTLHDHLQRLKGSVDGDEGNLFASNNNDCSSVSSWQLLPYYPPLYSTIRSINGVPLQALDKDHQMALVKQRCRPLVIEFDITEDEGLTPPAFLQASSSKQVPNTPSSSSGKRSTTSEPTSPTSPGASADIGMSQSFFMTKYTHNAMSKLRRQIDKLIQDFVQCDWKTAKKQNTGSPQMTMISLYKYIEAEMIKLDLFNAKHKQRGVGAPIEMTERHWQLLRDHIECFMYARVSDYAKTLLYPIYRKVWIPLTELDDLFSSNDGDSEGEEVEEEEHDEGRDSLPKTAAVKPTRVDYVLMIHPNLSVTTHYHPKNTTKQRLHRRVILSPDHHLQERMSYYRFVLLTHLGAKSTKESLPSSLPLLEEIRHIDTIHQTLLQREEWYLAMKALQMAIQESLPSRILQRLTLVFQMISAALMTYLQAGVTAGMKTMWLCPHCNQCHVSQLSAEDANLEEKLQATICLEQQQQASQRVDEAIMISADDLLPAIIWTLLQSNPILIEQAIWICTEFRHPNLLRGEEGYCLAQLSSAIEFCQYVTASQLDVSTALHDMVLLRSMQSRRLLQACEHGDVLLVQQCLGEEAEEGERYAVDDDVDVAHTMADVNAYDLHYQHCALSKAIVHHHFAIVCILLQQPQIRVNQPLFLFNGGAQERSTALILAVQHVQVKMIVALLHAGANRYQVDEQGKSPLAHAKLLLTNAQPSSSGEVVAIKKESVRLMELVLYADYMKFNIATVMLTARYTLQHLTLTELDQYPTLPYFCPPAVHSRLIKQKGQYRNLEAESILVGLLLQGVDINQGPVFTPLIAAVLSGNMTMLRLVLLAAHCGVSSALDIDARNQYGETALLVAIKCCLLTKRWIFFQMAAMLLRYGAQRHLSYHLQGKEQAVLDLVQSVVNNPFACEGEEDEQYRTQLISGSIEDYLKLYPTHARTNIFAQVEEAAQTKDEDPLDVKEVAAMMWSPRDLDLEELLMTTMMNDEEIFAQLLLLLQINPFAEDSTTLKIYESAKLRSIANVRILLLQGVDVNCICIKKGYHALIAAVFNEDLAMLSLLLDDANYLNALTCCIHREEIFATAEIVKWAEVYVDYYNVAPSMALLHLPLQHDTTTSHDAKTRFTTHPNTSFTRLDANLKGRGGMTALHYAAQLGNFTILIALIKHGVDRYLMNDKQHRALDIVLLNHTQKELANVLRYDPVKVSICLAGKHGDLTVLTALLHQGVSINYIDPLCLDPKLSITLTPALIREQVKLKNGVGIRYDLFCPLISMAAAGQYELMRAIFSDEFAEALLVEEDVDVDMVTPIQQTALMYAAALGHENMVVLLLKHGADRYVRDIADMSAWDWAMSQDHPTVGRILQHDPNRVYIHDLIRDGDFEGVIAMLKQGVDVNLARESLDPFPSTRGNRGGSMTGQDAAPAAAGSAASASPQRRNSSLISWIRNTPTTTNERSFIPGERPLIVAARFNRLDIMKLLLKAPDIRIDDVDANGWTALFHAGFVGHESMVLTLLQGGASREVLDKQGFSAVNVALHHHIVFGGSNAINPVASLTYSPSVAQQEIAALIEADPFRMHIHDVCEQGRIHHVKAIFKQGCPVNYRDERPGKSHQTPLLAASSGGKADVVKLLLRNEEIVKAINERDDEGKTALMRAAAISAFDVTALLLNAGCDRNLKDHKGMTAVEHAATNGFSTKMQFISQTMIR